MIDHNQSHCDPPDIINVHLSHKNTTFAIIFNIIVKNHKGGVQQVCFTDLRYSC